MREEIFFSEFIAVALKKDGFNCEVEAGFLRHAQFNESLTRKSFRKVLRQIDHQTLEMTSASLCRWIFDSLQKTGDLHPVEVSVRFGNDRCVKLRPAT